MKKKMVVLSSCLMLLLGVCSLVLTGCGGSDDTTTPTPATTNASPAVPSPTMTGVWHGTFDTAVEFALSLTQNDNVLSGTYTRNDASGSGTASGQINDNTVDLTTVREPGHIISQWHGTVNVERTGSSGTWTIVSGGSGSGTFSMNK
ncbi:MAG: hypothetical protein NTV49_00275 [Kiritimatiellaeota bacterium]|nr:hypothetical protein [Kiritimatiellota bacterium]